MDYNIEFDKRPDFLLATITGSNSVENVVAYIDDIVVVCKIRSCEWVLIDDRLDGPRLALDDVFDITADGAQKLLGVFRAIAYVDEKMGEIADFIENVALNRGMPIRTFASFVDAERWLVEQRTVAGSQ